MKIAVIDDDVFIRQMLKIGLHRFGHEVITFSDGMDAWEYLQQEPIRLIITDWMMPRMDGLELIHHIRGASFPGYIYLILLSGKEQKGDVVEGLDAGADDYLVKPFDMNELRARVAIGRRIIDLESNLTEAMEREKKMAMSDYLTGLLNRRAIYDRFEVELARTQRNDTPFGIVLIDIDHFKNINDQYGHIIGDRALILVAEQISHSIRKYDWAGRWGGDEFVVLVPGASEEDCKAIADRIIERIADLPLLVEEGKSIQMQVSIGVYDHLDSPISLESLIATVDEALYQAKESGRGKVVVVRKGDV